MLITGGYNVYPSEIEELIARHPSAEEAIVLGLPEQRLGTELVAIVKAAHGQDVTTVPTSCSEQLPRYKIPRRFYVVDQWPMTNSGKISRRTLEDWLAESNPKLTRLK